MALTDKIKKDIIDKKQRKSESIEYFKEEILVTDALKEDYDNAVISIDVDLLTDINTVNDTLYAVTEAYQNRVDFGCRGDLYWAIESFTPGSSGPPATSDSYTLRCSRLSPVSSASSITVIDPSTSGITTVLPGEIPFIGTGIVSDNLHGIKYYWEPYLRDIGDTTIGSFIGFVGTASTELSVVSAVSDQVISGFSTGNLVISSKNGVFGGSSNSNRIVGFGTTVVTGISTSVMQELVGVSTTSYQFSTLILENSTVGFATLPESDGSYVDFTVVTDPDTFEELVEDKRGKGFRYKIPFDKNPYSPQKIGILDLSTAGKGTEIIYDNSGNPSNEQSWKPEYEGIEKGGEKIKEPNVGAGRTYYVIGFTNKPIKLFGGEDAVEGDTITVSSLGGLYSPISAPGGCTARETAITNAIGTRDSAEASLSSAGGCITNKVKAANAIRKERSDYALKIWTLRQSIGNEVERYAEYEALETYIEQEKTSIDGTGTVSCL
jgi:hypothetical protein